MTDLLRRLDGKLIVSCQPVAGGPLDRLDIVVAFALAAVAGGAAGLRIEGVANVREVRTATTLPIIGLVKRPEPGHPIIITATVRDVRELAEAGADIVAFDATHRRRPEPVGDLVTATHAAGRLAMADLSTLAEAQEAAALGCDILGTTLSGYTGGPVPDEPDLELVAACARLGRPVFAEGRYRTEEQVRAARRAGAAAVVVGSAITRPEHITAWFAAAVGAPGPGAAP